LKKFWRPLHCSGMKSDLSSSRASSSIEWSVLSGSFQTEETTISTDIKRFIQFSLRSEIGWGLITFWPPCTPFEIKSSFRGIGSYAPRLKTSGADHQSISRRTLLSSLRVPPDPVNRPCSMPVDRNNWVISKQPSYFEIKNISK
jgi:hypothetical protein